jgi:uncharacterized protein involved in response to NO
MLYGKVFYSVVTFSKQPVKSNWRIVRIALLKFPKLSINTCFCIYLVICYMRILWHDAWKREYFIATQLLGKQVPAEINAHAIIQEPVSKQRIGKHKTIRVFEKVFSIWSVISGFKKNSVEHNQPSRVEAGSNTCTVALRVVGDHEKRSLESEAVKYGRESYGTQTRKLLRWREPAIIINNRPILLSERAPHINKPTTIWQ